MPTSRFSNFLFHREPAWRSYRRVPRDAIPVALRPWLLDQGSLTERLVAASGGRFAVEVLNQRWELPRLSEIRAIQSRLAKYHRGRVGAHQVASTEVGARPQELRRAGERCPAVLLPSFIAHRSIFVA